ncbi:MAG: HAMP domain-containing histidine kinase [Eubacterium sp.]|nr:HAMP domain-containing histidine kinase [Eubacterium sp.]
MNEYKNLQFYILKQFLFVIVFISAAEYGILLLLKNKMLPVIMHYFFDDADVKKLGAAAILSLFVVMCGMLILQLINSLIPGEPGYFLEHSLDKMNLRADSVLGGRKDILGHLNVTQELILFLVILSAVIIILLPYIIGGIYFARAVIKQVRVIEEEDRKKQKEYEKKRNLMLSDIAHDLRTPITTVNGYAKALADGMVSDDKKQEYLNAIQKKSKRLADLINLLFEYVKLDSEGFNLTKQDTDVCELVRECAAFVYQDIEDAGMELDIDVPEEEMIINLDKIQMTRVITNLLNNAIKHSGSGSKIGVFVNKEDDKIRISVADSGKRIDDDSARNIFIPFVVGDESRNSKGGTGLGLSIAKKVVDMHGFSIRLIQRPGLKRYIENPEYEKVFMITIDSLH